MLLPASCTRLRARREPLRRTSSARTVLALVAVVGLVSCGSSGDDSPEEVQADLAEELRAQLDLDEEQSDCFAEVLVEEIGAEELQDVDFTAQEPPEGMEEELTAAATIAIDTCDIDVSAAGG